LIIDKRAMLYLGVRGIIMLRVNFEAGSGFERASGIRLNKPIGRELNDADIVIRRNLSYAVANLIGAAVQKVWQAGTGDIGDVPEGLLARGWVIRGKYDQRTANDDQR
jgi:hypothetical protein